MDSDDEDVPLPTAFQSRFGDSSDEETAPVKMRPVRGIPRRGNEGDSTELEDSSDDETRVEKPKILITSSGGASGQHITGLESEKPSDEPLSPTTEKRKGFFGRLRSKKPKKESQRISRAGLESSIQREAYLEQAKVEMERAKTPETPTSPPKLQRRTTPKRVMSDSWPLPEKVTADDGDRPLTSDGINNVANDTMPAAGFRPGLAPRQNTSSTVRSAGGTPVYGRSGKKKRFPLLRRALGLYD